MPKINIQTGTKIQSISKEDTIILQIPNTKFLCEGIRQKNKSWTLYIIDPQMETKKKIVDNINTLSFSMYANLFLKADKLIRKKEERTLNNIINTINKKIKNHA